jgi:FdhD protein
MVRRRSERMIVTTVTPDGVRRHPDELIVEEPLSIQLDGTLVSTTMRTPGHDFELAVGFCLTEGLLGDATVSGVRYCADGSALESGFNVVTVETGGRAPTPSPRLGTTSSSCGMCGTEALDAVADRLAPLPADACVSIPLGVIARMPSTVAGDQGLFASTGAVHAAAAFGPDGEVVIVREDVGRHNAVDKVVGRFALDGRLPAHEFGLFVSGRASFEMVHKAWAAGFGTVVAVSAPTALAVAMARRAGITLAGFVRADRVNIYSPERAMVDEGDAAALAP